MMDRLSKDDIERIAKELHARLKAEQALHWIEPESHAEQHKYISEWMKARADRRAMWRRIRENVIGWFIIVVIGGGVTFIGSAVYRYAVDLLQHARPHG